MSTQIHTGGCQCGAIRFCVTGDLNDASICHCRMCQKAFGAYLGDDRAAWHSYDATALVASASERLPLLVDQGDADEFLNAQLKPELLQAACAAAGHPLLLRMRPGHDHSYYFIASFIGEHVAHHAAALRRGTTAGN